MQNVAEESTIQPQALEEEQLDRSAPALCPCTDGGRNQPAEDCTCDNGEVR